MLYFFADNHFGKHPGRLMYDRLPLTDKCRFFEDDWTAFASPEFAQDCSLLMLNMIGDTCGIAHPGPDAERAVRAYAEKGGSFLLLHGASAAFWRWDWWRAMVGLRWVRGEDPDGVAPSTHPVRPFDLTVCKCRHPLAKKLQPVCLPTDEIYIHLEQTAPVTVLLQTDTDEGTFPQCWEAATPWGGRILGYLPGHNTETFEVPAYMENIRILLSDLQ